MPSDQERLSVAENSRKNNKNESRVQRNKAAHLERFRWPKGVTGNAGGRPKRRPVSERYSMVAETPLPERMGLSPGATCAHAGALGIFLAAIKGHPGAAREIREAIERKASQRVEVAGSESEPIRVSLAETLERIREFYGLRPPTTTPQKPADLDSVPA
jgi:hypothetical protein